MALCSICFATLADRVALAEGAPPGAPPVARCASREEPGMAPPVRGVPIVPAVAGEPLADACCPGAAHRGLMRSP